MLESVPPAAGGVSPPPDPAAYLYVVRIGDTLESVLERHGLRTDADRRAFFDANPGLNSNGQLTPGQVVRIPPSPVAASTTFNPNIQTSWTNGYGRNLAGQNRYNDALQAAQKRWPGVDPLILKSILAQETGFREQAFAANPHGYAGVAQLGIDEAHEAGLDTGRSRMGRNGRAPFYDRAADERFDPAKAIPAAAVILRNKERALESGARTRSGVRLHGYSFYGEPRGDDRWRLAAAAYNGGQGTILRAMRHAYGETPPGQVRWNDLLRSPTGNIRDSPLWRAIAEVGMDPASKYREIAEYAANVVARARQ